MDSGIDHNLYRYFLLTGVFQGKYTVPKMGFQAVDSWSIQNLINDVIIIRLQSRYTWDKNSQRDMKDNGWADSSTRPCHQKDKGLTVVDWSAENVEPNTKFGELIKDLYFITYTGLENSSYSSPSHCWRGCSIRRCAWTQARYHNPNVKDTWCAAVCWQRGGDPHHSVTPIAIVSSGTECRIVMP